MSAEGRIIRIELHDSRLGSIEVLSSGRVEVSFRHLVVVREESDGRQLVWSYSGVLELHGVGRFLLSGQMGSRDYVSDGNLRAPTGTEIDLATVVGEPCGAGTLYLLLAGSGAVVDASFSSAALVRMSPIKSLEEWTED